MSLLLAVWGWDREEWAARIRARAPERTLQVAPDAVDDPEAVRYAFAWRVPPGLLARFPNIEVIFSLGAGVDHLVTDPELPDVPIVRIVDPSLTRRMTEWVVLQVLMHHRRQLLFFELQRRAEWRQPQLPMASEIRVGVMGLGELGGDTAAMLAHIGYQVAGWSRSQKTLAGVDCHHGDTGLETFLARTDILVSLLPLTDATVGILDYELLKKLPHDGAVEGPALINAGRGKLQVETDIIRALDDGTLAGASLDVFETEPLPKSSPLWAHPRVIVTPHVSAESNPDHLTGYVLDQIETFEADGTLTNLVDRDRGY